MQSVSFDISLTKATAVTADDTAGYLDFTTGHAFVGAALVQIVRSGKQLNSDPAITLNGTPGAGKVRVGDGSTYAVTAGDIITVLSSPKPL